MSEFTEILGNRRNLQHLSEANARGRLSHAYIICGPSGSGRRTFINYISAALLCERMQPDTEGQQDLFSMFNIAQTQPRSLADGPCGECQACVKTASDNHPDIVWLKREKENLISVKDIRQQVIADMAVKPYYGPYKIYIIEDAQLMNENAQNALLKTIEEPPEYGMIFLLTDNSDALLDTIRSRCIRLDMEKLPADVIRQQLKKSFSIDDRKAYELAAFSGGNLGRALQLAGEDEEGAFITETVKTLKAAERMNAADIFDAAVSASKADAKETAMITQMWFRDVLLVKSEGIIAAEGTLYFPGETKALIHQAEKISFEGIDTIFKETDKARKRLDANVKSEAVLENLLLAVRRVCRSGR